MSRRSRNRTQIERFVKFYDLLHRSSAGSKIDTTAFTGKAESSPPISDPGMHYIDMDCNQHAAKIIEPELQWLRRMFRAGRHRAEWKAVNTVAGYDTDADYSALVRWKAGATDQAKMYAWAFTHAIDLIEQRIHQKHPEIELSVELPDPKEELDNHQLAMANRKERTKETREKIYAQFVAMGEDVPRMQRYQMLADRFGVHPDTVRNAIRFSESEESEAKQRDKKT